MYCSFMYSYDRVQRNSDTNPVLVKPSNANSLSSTKKKFAKRTTVLILETHKKNHNLPDKQLRDGVNRLDKAFATSWSSEYFRVPG